MVYHTKYYLKKRIFERKSSFAAQNVAEAIGTQSVKVLLVHMCLCLVGTYEPMFSCMNMSVFWLIGVYICWVGTYELYLVLRTCLCSVVSTCKSLRIRVCICCVGTYEPMFSCKNISAFSQRIFWYVCVSVWLVHMSLCLVVWRGLCYDWYMCLFIGLVHKSLCVVLRICLRSVKGFVGTCVSLFGWYIWVYV